MKAVSNTGLIEPIGKRVIIFSDAPCSAGDEFEIIDRCGRVVNIAVALQVVENQAPGLRYIVTGEVIA